MASDFEVLSGGCDSQSSDMFDSQDELSDSNGERESSVALDTATRSLARVKYATDEQVYESSL